jgi:chromosome segregation ATPase
MVYEAPELLETGDKLRFAKARKRPVYEVIASLNEKISILTQDLAEAEMLNTSLQDKVESLEGSLKVTEEMSETSRKELTKNEERLIGIDRIYRQTQQDMMKLQKINEVQEDALRLLEGIKSSLMKVAEREGSTDSFNDAINKIDMIKDILHQKTLAPAPIIQSEKSK